MSPPLPPPRPSSFHSQHLCSIWHSLLRLKLQSGPCCSGSRWTPDWQVGSGAGTGGILFCGFRLHKHHYRPPTLALGETFSGDHHFIRNFKCWCVRPSPGSRKNGVNKNLIIFFFFFKIVQRWDESTHVMCPRQVVHLRMHADSVIFLAGCLEPSASSSSKESFSERSSARFKLCRTLV